MCVCLCACYNNSEQQKIRNTLQNNNWPTCVHSLCWGVFLKRVSVRGCARVCQAVMPGAILPHRGDSEDAGRGRMSTACHPSLTFSQEKKQIVSEKKERSERRGCQRLPYDVTGDERKQAVYISSSCLKTAPRRVEERRQRTAVVLFMARETSFPRRLIGTIIGLIGHSLQARTGPGSGRPRRDTHSHTHTHLHSFCCTPHTHTHSFTTPRGSHMERTKGLLCGPFVSLSHAQPRLSTPALSAVVLVSGCKASRRLQ